MLSKGYTQYTQYTCNAPLVKSGMGPARCGPWPATAVDMTFTTQDMAYEACGRDGTLLHMSSSPEQNIMVHVGCIGSFKWQKRLRLRSNVDECEYVAPGVRQ